MKGKQKIGIVIFIVLILVIVAIKFFSDDEKGVNRNKC